MALQVWLPLNGNLDNQGVSNVTVTNNGATVSDNGKIGKGYEFTTTQYLEINNLPFSQLTNCSISFWIKVTGMGSNGWLPFAGQTTSYFILATQSNTSNFYHNNIGSNAKSIYIDGVLGTKPGSLNEWHHYCITGVDLSTWTKFYINKYSSAFCFAGCLNDVRIYDHCLSPKEVSEIAKGLVLHYKLDDIPQQNLLPEISDANYSIANYSNRTPGTINNGVYHVDGYQSSTSVDTSFGIQTKSYLTLQADTDYYLSFYCKGKCDSSIYFGNNVTNNAQTRLKSDSGNLYRPLESKTLGTEFSEFVVLKYHTGSETQYHLCIGFDTPNLYGIGSYMEFSNINLTTDDPSIRLISNQSIVQDCSGYNHNGEIMGTLTLNADSPRYKKSIKNTDGYIVKTSMYFPESKGLTISCWMNIQTWGYQSSGLWATSNNANTCSDYLTTTCHQYDNCFAFKGTNNSVYKISSITTYGITSNEWHLITVTHDGTSGKLYIDGILKTTQSIPTSLVSFSYLYLGISQCSGNRIVKGNWSDFRIYATALSEDNIKELYNTSAYVDNKQNMECFEIREDIITEAQITKRGQIECNTLTEETEASIDGDGNIECNQIIEI